MADKASRVFDTIAGELGVDRNDPLDIAGRALSAAIDAGAGDAWRNPYHNAQHFCEVMLGAHFLCLLHGLAAHDARTVALAALIHDFHHDGSVNGDVPFRLERSALQEAAPFLDEAGVDAQDQRLLAAMVLATDVANGLGMALRCHAHHARGTPAPAVPAAAPELAELARTPLAASQALILCEADVLPSVGLTVEHATQLHDRLSQEWRTPLGPEDKLWFMNHHLCPGVMSAFFAPNVRVLRQTLVSLLHAR